MLVTHMDDKYRKRYSHILWRDLDSFSLYSLYPCVAQARQPTIASSTQEGHSYFSSLPADKSSSPFLVGINLFHFPRLRGVHDHKAPTSQLDHKIQNGKDQRN